MHSSRMRTGRSLTVSRSLLPRGALLPGGCLFWGMSAPGDVSAPGGVSALGGLVPGGYVCSRGGGGGGGGGIPACTEADPPALLTESQMPVKTLPWPNFVAAGKNVKVISV